LVKQATRTATIGLNGRVMIRQRTGVTNFTDDGVVIGPDPLRARLDLWKKVFEKGQ
jgi:hypothetical protein